MNWSSVDGDTALFVILQEPTYEIVDIVRGNMSTAAGDPRFVHASGGFALSEGMQKRFKAYPAHGIEGMKHVEPGRWYFTGILEASPDDNER